MVSQKHSWSLQGVSVQNQNKQAFPEVRPRIWKKKYAYVIPHAAIDAVVMLMKKHV